MSFMATNMLDEDKEEKTAAALMHLYPQTDKNYYTTMEIEAGLDDEFARWCAWLKRRILRDRNS